MGTAELLLEMGEQEGKNQSEISTSPWEAVRRVPLGYRHSYVIQEIIFCRDSGGVGIWYE